LLVVQVVEPAVGPLVPQEEQETHPQLVQLKEQLEVIQELPQMV
tara:strand:+ start:377 stop:508 length:132 start_codon:yes stop_codon:yes gene_type:complete